MTVSELKADGRGKSARLTHGAATSGRHATTAAHGSRALLPVRGTAASLSRTHRRGSPMAPASLPPVVIHFGMGGGRKAALLVDARSGGRRWVPIDITFQRHPARNHGHHPRQFGPHT